MDQVAEGKVSPIFSSETAVDITPAQDGGVLKEIKVEGGDLSPWKGCTVSVHYVGYFTDGTVFDSSRDRGQQFSFVVGKEEVIKAWDLLLPTMKKGEVAVILSKPTYAYGSKGYFDKIPPNSDLIFEIELISWQDDDLTSKKDKGVIRRILVEGTGKEHPNLGAQVDVTLVGCLDGRIFEDRTVNFCLGEGEDELIVHGLELALEKFRKGEKSRIKLSPTYAYGEKGHAEFNIPPNANLEYEVTLNNFEKAKDVWELDSKEKIEQSRIFKEKGTKLFKKGNFKRAAKFYGKIENYLSGEKGTSLEEWTEIGEILLASHLNLALCYLKLEDFPSAISHCDSALRLDKVNEKALFRRGQARLGTHDYDLALEDLTKLLAIDDSNQAAKQQIAVCRQRMKLEKDRERKTYANMFQIFADRDLRREEILKAQRGDVLKTLGVWGEEDQNKESLDEVEIDRDALNSLKENVEMI